MRQVRTSGGEGNPEQSSLASVTWWPMAVNWRHSGSLRWIPKPQDTEHYRMKENRIEQNGNVYDRPNSTFLLSDRTLILDDSVKHQIGLCLVTVGVFFCTCQVLL